MKRALALVLTALTGFSGLVYEVAWEKYLATLLGSHSEATAAVLGIFLGGLSLGYSLFGSITRRVVAAGRAGGLLVLYGLVEAGIGAYVLVFPSLFGVAVTASGLLPQGVTGVGFALDILLSALLIGPPAVLMGGTIPILTQALSKDAGESTRFHAFVYAFNTAGAFAGALAAAFLLIPRFGLNGVMTAMGIVNLSAGTIFGLLGLASFAKRSDADPSAAKRERVDSFATYAGAALLIGFAMMTLQTTLIRIGGLSFGASQFTFSMVVAVFVLCIALGSFAVSALSAIPRATLVVTQWLLVATLFVLYQGIPYAPYAAHVLRTLFRDTDAAFHPFYLSAFLAVALLIGPAVILSGAALPLLFHGLRRELRDVGAVAGRLYSWNTFGSLLGALLGGYALLFWLDLHQVYRVALGAVILAAALLSTKLPGRQRWLGVGLSLPAFLALVLVAPWDPLYLAYGPFRERMPQPESYAGAASYLAPLHRSTRLRFYEDDPVASVAVLESPVPGDGVSRSIINNGKSDGNTHNDYPTMALAALVPGLLAEQTQTGFVIGYGTGVTVGELAALPGMQRVVVAEISAGVIEAAPLFDYANLNVTKNPKVEILRSDAYRALLRSEGRFDVIASEPSNPWVAGVEMLYSREFLSAARDRLSPGGVYAQWYHQYASDDEAVALVFRTYASVFDRIAVWYGLGPDLLLLGFRDREEAPDLEMLQQRAALPEFAAGLERSGVRSFPGLLAHEVLPMGVVHATKFSGPVHTLYRPILGYRAARAFFRGQRAELPATGFGAAARVGARNSLLRRYIEAADPARETLFEAVCQPRARSGECIALLASWWRAEPESAELVGFVRRAAAHERMFGDPVTIETVKRVAPLFRDPKERADDGPVSLREAQHATRDFGRYYSHATPFSPPALLELWKRCEEPEGGRQCVAGRNRARGLW